MIRNYLLIAVRNLTKNSLHTTINVMGLAFGMASVFLIAVYILGELSYDRFYDHADDLYRISWNDDNPQTRTPHPMAQALVNDFPEVQSAVSLSPLFASGLTKETHSFRNPQKKERFDEKGILAVDTTFFDVFDFPVVKGDGKAALKEVSGILMSESMAQKYFGNDEPVGRFIAVDSAEYLVQVLAIFKDVPENSHFHFDFLVSYVREKTLSPDNPFYQWKDFGHYNYIRLQPGTDARTLEQKLMSWSSTYTGWAPETYSAMKAQGHGFKLQKVTDIHLHSKLRWELETNGNWDYILILGAAAVFTLLIACVNFMNLTTAKSVDRAREIGVRKSMGAFRRQLAFQFLAESILTAMLAAVISLFIVQIATPVFERLVARDITIDYTGYLFSAVAGASAIGLISGVYPAIYLSGVSPLTVLKGKFVHSSGGQRFRKSLTVFQFSISMVLICSAMIVFQQLNFLKNKQLGFSSDQVIVVPIKNEDGISRFETFRNELLRVPGVTAASAASNIPGHQFNQRSIRLSENPDYRINSSEAYVDYDFFGVMDIETKEGRLFDKSSEADLDVFILNETAARNLRQDGQVVGKELLWNVGDKDIKGMIAGVVKDFHFQSLHEPIRPLMFRLTKRRFNYVVVRIDARQFESSMAGIENVYRTFDPTYGFEFHFLDQDLDAQYKAEEKTANLLTLYSTLALVIACSGLFGMSMIMYYLKAREMSIRKVLGASLGNIMRLLLMDFTVLVGIAIVVGIPVAWLLMSRWLEGFSFQVSIHPFVFVTAASVLLITAWGTLSYFAIKTSRVNPAETLKNE